MLKASERLRAPVVETFFVFTRPSRATSLGEIGRWPSGPFWSAQGVCFAISDRALRPVDFSTLSIAGAYGNSSRAKLPAVPLLVSSDRFRTP